MEEHEDLVKLMDGEKATKTHIETYRRRIRPDSMPVVNNS
jgi:hypothetical protein